MWRHDFSYHVMFIHNVFINIFKRKACRAFCLPFERMAAVYQLKIRYDLDKWGAIFLDSFETINFSRQRLIDKIRKVTSRFNNIDDQDLRIRYLDDEKTFIDLSDQNSVQEMFRCGVPVENAEFKRITVMVEQSNSPAPILQRKRASEQQSVSPSCMPSTSKMGKTASRRSLEFENKTKQGSGSLQLTGSTSCFKSPLEKYLENQEEKLRSLESKEQKFTSWIESYRNCLKETKCKGGPTCSNCHRQEGHNRLNCPYQCCETFFHCGAISKHPEEKAQLKELEKQRQEVLKDIESVRNAMQVKQAAARSIQERYVYKVRRHLIESDPGRYLTTGDDGQCIENWFLLNKDAKQLQVILNGKLPAPGTNLEKILSAEQCDVARNYSGKTSVRNPYRKLWEDRGINWPNTSSQPGVPSYLSLLEMPSVCHGEAEMPSPFPPDDDFMLAVGIQESLKTSRPQDIDYCLPPRPLARDKPKSIQFTETDTRASQSKSTSDAFSGLSALAKACEDVTDVTLN